jgi:hypothetical protein
MVSKIFEILSAIKKTSTITQAEKNNASVQITNEVSAGKINPIEAYIMLDSMKSIIEESLKGIQQQTLEHIVKEGENKAFGVELAIVATNEYNFKEDKDWSDINKQMTMYKDAMDVREQFLKNIVTECINAGRTAPITFQKKYSINPKFTSNT